MSSGRKARRQLDRQLRREGKPRALFRVVMLKGGHIAESVNIEPQDIRAMIGSVELLLVRLKRDVAPAPTPTPPLPGVEGVNLEGARTGRWSSSAPQIAAVKYFGRKEETA